MMVPTRSAEEAMGSSDCGSPIIARLALWARLRPGNASAKAAKAPMAPRRKCVADFIRKETSRMEALPRADDAEFLSKAIACEILLISYSRCQWVRGGRE